MLFKTEGTTFEIYSFCFAVLAIPGAITIILLLFTKFRFPNPERFEPEPKEYIPFKMKKEFIFYIAGISLFAFGFIDYSIVIMLSLESICKRFSHLGIKAHCVGGITEPHLNPEDLLIVGSGSGTTLFPLAIAKKARETVGCRIAHIGSAVNSPVDDYADYLVRIPVRTKLYLEDEIDSCQPMTTLFDQSLLLVGDILAKMIIDEKHLDMKSLWQYHANME